MRIGDVHYCSIWFDPGAPDCVSVIDQRQLPHRLVFRVLRDYRDGVRAIENMLVRGAPLIGATAAWTIYLALREEQSETHPRKAADALLATRPTGNNLHWAVQRMLDAIVSDDAKLQIEKARQEAQRICDEDVEINRRIGEHGLAIMEEIVRRKKGAAVNVLTHCNAGWLATVDWGTATAPVYLAHDRGLPVHVWVDETRPRNQGANLTAWELGQHGVPHTVIVDSAGGHLMQRGMVDLCLVGTDRVTRRGDVANKIGTYLKALAAYDNNVPFYVALPSPTIDWTADDGVVDIPIEERGSEEVSNIWGLHEGEILDVRITPAQSPSKNYGFDITPARLVTGLITERGICDANARDLALLFPEHARRVSA